MRHRNVVLFGKMASGKSTIADVLASSHYTRTSFAAPLKMMAQMAYGEIRKGETYEIMDPSEYGNIIRVSGRHLLQAIGTAINEHVDREFWIKCLLRNVSLLGDTAVVVDDGRFRSEFEATKRLGWLMVGVNTHDAARVQRYEALHGRTPSTDELRHVSEVEIDDLLFRCDIVVQGTDDPYWNAKRILEAAKDGDQSQTHATSGLPVPSM